MSSTPIKPSWKPTDPRSPLSSEERIELARLAVEGSRNVSGNPAPELFSLRDRGLITLDPLHSGRSEFRSKSWYLRITDAGRAALEPDERAAVVAEFLFED